MCRYVLVLVLLLGGCAYRSEDVTFPSGDILLAGNLVVPSTGGPHPAIVFVHGDGPDTRLGYRQYAQEFAKRGIAALVYDKRGCGESGGQWPARFAELAQDAAAGIQFLRTRTDIDATRIGVWGGSQGGWIAPLAATLPSARVHFVVVKAGPAVGPAELARWKSVSRVARAGYGPDVISRVNHLMDLQFEILRSGRGWAELHEHVRAATGEKWLPLVAIMRYSPWRSSWMTYGRDIDFDPTATLMRVDAPVLWLLGEKDPETPLRMTIDQLERLRRARKNITIKVFTGADHQIELPRRWKRRPNYAPGYPETMIDWVEAQCARHRSYMPSRSGAQLLTAADAGALVAASGAPLCRWATGDSPRLRERSVGRRAVKNWPRAGRVGLLRMKTSPPSSNDFRRRASSLGSSPASQVPTRRPSRSTS